MRRDLAAMGQGADAVYCPMRWSEVQALAQAGIPVVGHVGFVRRKATWTGGLRGVGKTAQEAGAMLGAVKSYGAAGAIAVEMELVPARVATQMSARTSMIVLSMGSGGGCDGDVLFASAILGETEGRTPRHARIYADMKPEYARLLRIKTDALTAFGHDAATGDFPGSSEIVAIGEDDYQAFCAALPA